MNILQKLNKKLFGAEYAMTTDHDGELRIARIKRITNGKILVKKLYGWTEALPDGTTRTYIKSWKIL